MLDPQLAGLWLTLGLLAAAVGEQGGGETGRWGGAQHARAASAGCSSPPPCQPQPRPRPLLSSGYLAYTQLAAAGLIKRAPKRRAVVTAAAPGDEAQWLKVGRSGGVG